MCYLVINLASWPITLVVCVIKMSNIFTLAAPMPYHLTSLGSLAVVSHS